MDKELVVDATGHVAGKLASYIAKKLLSGYKVHVVGTENVCFTGPIHRHVGKYKSYRNKRSIYNPMRGPFHKREPSEYFIKIVRGMTPRKRKRGTTALENLKCYEGIPKQFENVTRVVFPKALISVTADPSRPHCTLGQILSRFGWQHGELAAKLTLDFKEREAKTLEAILRESEEKNKMLENESFVTELNKRLEEYA